MPWKSRLFLSVVILCGALFFGFTGGFLSKFLSPLWWGLALVLLSAAILPWKALVFSQEELTHEVRALVASLDKLETVHQDMRTLLQELDEAGALKQEELDPLIERYLQQRTPAPEDVRTLREMLFGEYRRTLVVSILMMGLAAFGGAIFAVFFYRFVL